MARYVDFDTDIGSLERGYGNGMILKLWMKKESCEEDGEKTNRKKFYELKRQFKM